MTERKTIARKREVPMSAFVLAADAFNPIAQAIQDLRNELLEEATLLNAEGWQSGEMQEPRWYEQGWDLSILVMMQMEMFKDD
jgi:hypothetical protein